MHTSLRLLLVLLALNGSKLRGASTVDLVPAADTCVAKAQPSVNFGTSTALIVASQAGGSYQDERVWLRFPLTAEVPPGATILSAELRLYVFDADDADPLEVATHGCDDDTWQETTLTWANQPAFQPAVLATATLAPATERLWYAWDVTAFVTNQWSGDRTASLVVKAATEGADPWRSYKVDSREFAKPAFRPVLRVTYEGSWPATGPIRIFHVNDAHARIVPHEIDIPEEQDIPRFERVGGAAYIGAKILEQKLAFPNSLILDAGDISEGNPVGDLRGNGAMVDFYKLLDAKLKALGGRGIDAIVVGNHDVRDRRMIDNLATNGAFPVLSMNICHKGTLTPYFTPFVTVNVAGRKVGILGYTNDESSYLDGDTVNLIDVVPCDWSDDDPGTIDIKPVVQQLRAQGCDFVVLLSHMGQSRLCTEDDALLEYDGDVPPPEVVVSGHWHSWTETAWQPAQLRYRTTVVESGSYLQYLGDLTVNGDGRYLSATQHVIRCDQILPDSDIANLVTNLIAEYNATLPSYALDQVIGYSAVDLTMDKDKWWTLNEYPWSSVNAAGAWICDAMCWKSVQAALPCDLAIQSGGGIRRDVPAGPITYLEIYECYPWEDDDMVRVQLTGQQIRDTLEDKRCGASISEGWTVYADEGVVTNVLFNGSPINLAGSYNVAISGYMYLHEGFATFDPVPEYIGFSIRQSIIDYTAQFGPENPLTVSGPRYILNTEMAGVFDAVVTLPVDAEDEAYYEAIFVRLLRASDNTVRWRGRYASAELVRADGTINPEHVFAETMLYRSHLGFADGLLRNGDIIRIHGEGGFHSGLPELIDQAGICANAQEWEILGRDESLAQPAFMPDIASFWNEEQEGRYVRFYALKVNNTKVEDATGQQITIHKAGGYYTQPLPGNTGDLLELTGVSGSRNADRRFRCHTVRLAAEAGVTAFPPWSRVRPVTPSRLSATPCLLQAEAGAFDGTSGGSLITVTSAADSQVVEGSPASNYGSATYMYVQSAPPTDTYRNERAWLRFDLAGRVAAGTAVQSAVLRVYCWRATGPDLDVVACGSANDLWTETGITWASQPAFGAAADSVTLRTGQANVWYEWDVSGLVSNSVAAGDLAVSVVLKAATEGLAAVHTFGFDGREYQNGTVAPELKITVAAPPGGPATGLRKVDFLYRHAADARAWSGWQPAGTVSNAPWQLEFACPAGVGHYEFYSQATDATGAVEPAPLLADAAVQFAPADADPLPPHDPAATALVSDPLGLSFTLSVQVEDPDGDVLDVSFYDSTGALIGVCTDVASGQTASVYWFRAPDSEATCWYAIAHDPTGRETRSADFALPGATPPLAAGDVTVLGYRTDAPDGFSFVTWRELPGGTALGFWDHGARANGRFRSVENTLVWYAPEARVPAGAVVVVSCPPGGPATASVGSVSNTLDELSSDGDQLFAAVGGTFPPDGGDLAYAYDGTLLYGLNVGLGWLRVGPPDDTTSWLPDALTGAYANRSAGPFDNGDYVGPRVGRSVAEFQALIHDPANWRQSNLGGAFGALDSTPFELGPPVVAIVTPSGSVPYETVAMTVSGTCARVTGDVAWTNSLGGNGVALRVGNVWTADVPLALGANTITVMAEGAAPVWIVLTRVLPPDPVLAIASPVDGTTLAREAATVTLTGSAAHCVGALIWTNAAAGVGGAFAPAGAWSVPEVEVTFGPNRLTIRGTNVLGAAAEASVTVQRPLLAQWASFTNLPGIGGAESLAYDFATRRLAVTGDDAVRLWYLADLAAPVLRAVVTANGDEKPTSVAAHDGLFAVAFARTDKSQPGRVRFVNANGQTLRTLTVGFHPDMVCFTPAGDRLLVANEGEPTDGCAADPEGSVSIVELGAGLEAATVRTAAFTPWNGQRDALRAAGVRISGRAGVATVAEDLEPEYIAISSNGATAWITLQENNAIATLDVAAGAFTRIDALGAFGPSNRFDASDRDGGIQIRDWPVRLMPQPDGLAAFAVGDACYLITANEGDQRDWGAFPDFARVKDLALDPAAFPDAATLKQDANLGRLRVATDLGDAGGDGDYDALYTFGSRSFSVWQVGDDGGAPARVYDSASLYEETVAAWHPELWNVWDDDDGGSLIVDQRSDNRGPEPEGVAVGTVGGRRYAFVGLERCGGIMVHDLADPAAPRWIQYQTTPGDIAPEVLAFVPAAQSPAGRALAAVANEGSGTVTFYDAPAETGVPARPPFVEILSPAAPLIVVDTETDRVTLQGVAADAVGRLCWSNLLTGAAGDLPVGADWSVVDVTLAEGTNQCVVAVTNALGAAWSAGVRVVRRSPALRPGDLAIVGWTDNTAPDVFTVATLAAIPAGTTIHFTDNGWTGSEFRGASVDGDGYEGLTALTVTVPVPAGQILRSDVDGSGYAWLRSGPIPGARAGVYSSLSLGSGDQIAAFLGMATNPLANVVQPLFLLDDTGAFEPCTSVSTGNIVPGLVAGSTALTFGSSVAGLLAFDFDRFAGQTLTRAEWLSLLAAPGNWKATASGTLPTGPFGVRGTAVAEPALLTGVSFDTVSGRWRIVAATVAGFDYQLRVKTNLLDATWLPAGARSRATGDSVLLEDPVDRGPQGFYQVETLAP